MLIIFFVLLAFILTGAYVYLRVKGKDLVVARMEEQLGRKISFKSVGFSYPLTIKIYGLDIEGYGSAKATSLSLNLAHLFLGEIYFNAVELIEPCVVFTHSSQDKVSFIPAIAQPRQEQRSCVKCAPAKEKKKDIVIFARKITIRSGSLEVYQSSGSGAQALAQVKNIDAQIDNIAFPVLKPLKTEFSCTAIATGFGGRLDNEELKISGWADFFKKDMLAQLKITGAGGQVGLKADLSSTNNDMLVKGSMKLSFQSKAVPDNREKNFEALFVQALQSSGADVDLSFQFKTKMDDFRASKISLSGELNKN
jgi:hypothetical protein